MKDICEGLPWWGHVLVWIAILVWEGFLGMTKFRSTMNLIRIQIASILGQKNEEKK